MALFSQKKETKEKDVAAPTEALLDPSTNDVSWVLRSPRITEKATDISGRGVYAFEVDPRANKVQIARAIAQTFKVTPIRVNVTKVQAKTVRNARTGKIGRTAEGKKAYVFLKKGETISLM